MKKIQPNPLTHQIPVELFSDISPDIERRELIDDFLPVNGTIVMFGIPGSGKSFAALDMALCVAQGRLWMGRGVLGGGVVFIGAEGQAGLRLRVEAWRRTFQPPNSIPFALIPCALDLLDPDADINPLKCVLDGLAERWGGIALVVVDTLAATFGGGDENGADMARYVANINCLCHPYQAARMIEPPRIYRRLFGLSQAAIFMSSSIS